jgi:hypothetical protein
MRFRLTEKDAAGNRTGPHFLGPDKKNGKFAKVVKPGEIVEFDQHLDVLFKNKFERLGIAVVEPAEVPEKTKGRRRK